MPDSTGDRKLLLFTAGPVACCTDGIIVFRIIDPPEHLVRLPGPGSHPLIFKLDNRLVRVVDVRALFGLEQHNSADAQSKLIVAEVNGELTGFWVDQVSIMISVSQGHWSSLPSVVPRSLFDAAFRYEDQLILHVDFNRMATASPTAWVYESGLYEVPAEISSGHEDEPDVAAPPLDTDDRPDDERVVDTQSVSEPPEESAQQVAGSKAASQLPPHVDHRPVPTIKVAHWHEAQKPQSVSHISQKPEKTVATEHSSTNHRSDAEPELYDSGQGAVWVWVLLLGAVVLLVLLFINFWPESESRVATVGGGAPVSVYPESNRSDAQNPPGREMAITVPDQITVIQPADEPWADQSDEDALDTIPALLAEPMLEEEFPVQDSSSIQREGNTVVISLPAEAELIDQEPEAGPASVDEAEVVATGPEPEVKPAGGTVVPTQEANLSGELKSMTGTEEVEAQTSVAEPALPETVIVEEVSHIVVKGDTLWAIAKRYINNPFRYPELARLSRIKDPDLIYPGDRVLIRIERRP